MPQPYVKFIYIMSYVLNAPTLCKKQYTAYDSCHMYKMSLPYDKFCFMLAYTKPFEKQKSKPHFMLVYMSSFVAKSKHVGLICHCM